MIFEPSLPSMLPSGLSVTESVLTLKKGTSHILILQVVNKTNHDIMLPERTPMGKLEMIRSVTPALIRPKTDSETMDKHKGTLKNCVMETVLQKDADSILSKIDFSGLTHDETEIVKKMLVKFLGLFKKQVKFLGRIVSDKGYIMDPDNIKAVTSLQDRIPKTVGEVRHLLGLLSYYRRFIPRFSIIASSLYELLTSNESQVKSQYQRRDRKNHNGQVSSSSKVEWTEEHQTALQELIKHLISPPIMAYPDPSLPYILHVDACQKGLGAVLYQRQEGKLPHAFREA